MDGLQIMLIAASLAAAPPAGLVPPGAPAPPAAREVVVSNRAHHTINELYISPETSGEWGADRLGDGTIAPDRSLRVAVEAGSECQFDLQVVYDDATREERHDVDVCRDHDVIFDYSRAVAPAGVAGGSHAVVIANESARPIQQVFVSPADSGDWGDDLLAHDSLSVGERATLTYRGVCLADLRIVYDNRSAEERRNVDVCTLHGVLVQPGWTTADLLAPLPQTQTQAARRGLPPANRPR